MKNISIVFLLYAQLSFAQETITPSYKKWNLSYLKPQSQTQTWYMLRDTTRIPIGEVETIIDPTFEKNKLLIIQKIKMNRSTAAWTDTAIADSKTLAPIYHSSYNAQRSMRLTYKSGKVTVWHKDHQTNQTVNLVEQPTGSYFDSNLSTHLVRWLPLKPGYQGKIVSYNYANEKSHGLETVTIKNVKEVNIDGSLTFVVSLQHDESKSDMIFYIRKSDRALLKSSIEMGGRKMEMQ